MATIKQFEDIEAWKEARQLSIDVYIALKSSKDFSFNDQLKRASVSIMNNIAEGFERQTDKEFKQFLYIAKGSAAEVRSMITLGEDLGYFTHDQSQKLIEQSRKISAMLSGFIKVL